MKIVDAASSLVRPAVTLALTGAVVYLAVTGRITPSEFIAIYGTVLGFWFAQRSAEKVEAQAVAAQARASEAQDRLVDALATNPPADGKRGKS